MEIVGGFKLAEGAYPNNNIPIGTEAYWDISGNYMFANFVEVFAGVSNVLDTAPPVLGFRAGGDSNTQAQLYDTVAWRFFVGTTIRLGAR